MILGSAPIRTLPLGADPIKPLTIKTLTLCDFRAFAGPEPIKIDLSGKNLLVYGENGAGKSSIFHALNEFFSAAQPNAISRQTRLRDLKNVFSGKPEADLFVEVELDDGKPPAKWTTTQHPVDATSGNADTRIVNGAYRKAILDYRSLLDTNYRQGDGEINLFEISVSVLLRDYPAIHNGKEVRLFDVWRNLNEYLDSKRYPQIHAIHRRIIASLSQSFNQALQSAVQALLPAANTLLTDLGWDDVRIDAITFPGIAFNIGRRRTERRFDDCTVKPTLRFLTYVPPTPQIFLNEARLSALAIAIYLAGRQICAHTLQADTPRLLVLDDVLIGLDQSNRLPVLDVLTKSFHAWQIVLLTYDRVWFEMARMHLDMKNGWTSLELYEEREPSGATRPVLKPRIGDPFDSHLLSARKFYANHENAAAAVHARMAFEISLKRLCEKKSIPVRFQPDPRKLSTDDLLNAVEAWLKDKPFKAQVDPAIHDIRLWRKVVLNPFSHSTPVNLAAAEVIGAIDAVAALNLAFQTHIPK